MSPRRHPFEDNNEDSSLATSSEESSLGSSSNGTSRDGVHEGAFELPLKYTARYEFEEYYHGKLVEKARGSMQGRASDTVGKGKASVATRRSKKPFSKI
ncbi:hypothetical protein ACOSQ4_004554 [Xanthoceras sorbifolium]